MANEHMTKVFFVRHAEVNYENHDDMSRELSEKGLRDRKLVTSFLMDKNIHTVLSSPYKRAVDTVRDFAESKGMDITVVESFKERKVAQVWIEDFDAYCKRQWEDFTYKLAGGECLKEVQDRNIAALQTVLSKYSGKNIVIGSHGFALSTILHYYDATFGYSDYATIRPLMPWIAEFIFEEHVCVAIRKHNVLESQAEKLQ